MGLGAKLILHFKLFSSLLPSNTRIQHPTLIQWEKSNRIKGIGQWCWLKSEPFAWTASSWGLSVYSLFRHYDTLPEKVSEAKQPTKEQQTHNWNLLIPEQQGLTNWWWPLVLHEKFKVRASVINRRAEWIFSFTDPLDPQRLGGKAKYKCTIHCCLLLYLVEVGMGHTNWRKATWIEPKGRRNQTFALVQTSRHAKDSRWLNKCCFHPTGFNILLRLITWGNTADKQTQPHTHWARLESSLPRLDATKLTARSSSACVTLRLTWMIPLFRDLSRRAKLQAV